MTSLKRGRAAAMSVPTPIPNHFRSRVSRTGFVNVLLLVLLIAGCGGDGGISVFSSARTVSVEGFADVEVIRRLPARVSEVAPLPESLTMARGGIAVFSATARDSDDRLLTGIAYTWRMRDPSAGNMSENGVFTAGNIPGNYPNAIEVVATQEFEGREFTAIGRANVLVTSGFFDTTIANVVIFPRTASGAPGDFVSLRAAATGENGGLVQDIDLFWRVTDPRVGRIDQTGGLSLGDTPGDYPDAVEVQARRLGGGGSPVIGRSSVTILSPEETAGGVRAIIGPSAVIGRRGSTVPLVLLTVDHNGRPIPTTRVEWSIDSTDVGSVSANGVLTLGETEGEFPSSVRGLAVLAGDHAGLTVSATLDVVILPPSRGATETGGQPQILPQSIRLPERGSVQLSLLTPTETGNPVTVRDADWRTTDSRFVVDERGRLTTSAAPGEYPDAVATSVVLPDGETVRITKAVTVLGELARVQATPVRATLEAGQIVQFLAEAYDAAGNRLHDVRFRWSLADGAPGTLTSSGLYVAEAGEGLFAGAIRVIATQRVVD